MSNIQEQAEEESCEPCRFATGIGFMDSLCKELEGDNVDCGELVKQVKSGEIKVNNFVDLLEGKLNKINNSDNKKESLVLFHKIKELMFKKRPVEVKEVKEVKDNV